MNLRHLQHNGAFSDIFRRHDANPILTAADWPYPVHSVFNPGAIRLQDGTTLLLCRCEDRRGFSHLTVARSDNGVDAWKIDAKPTFEPNPDKFPEELWGVEDPRITYLADEGIYVIAYTAFSKDGPGVSLAKTKDFKKFERISFAMQPDDKDAALFPRKFNGQYALIPPAYERHGRQHVDLLLARPQKLGRTQAASPCKAWSLVGRQQDRAEHTPHRNQGRLVGDLSRRAASRLGKPLPARLSPLRS